MVTDRAEVSKLKEQFGDAIRFATLKRDDLFIGVAVGDLHKVVTFLKQAMNFDYYSECVGVDYSTWTHARDWPAGEAKRFEVVHNFMSTKTFSRLFLKVTVEDGQPVPTVKDIFLGAEYPEREIQDLYGVEFEGNGPIKGERFLLPNDWVGYPLRKEVPLGGEDVVFDQHTLGPAVEDISMPHAGESFAGKTGSEGVSGR
ncbi:MAG: NADH-quinone oxidoreductase subunit C [Chthonomonas sp.]|nr:NADH-quinone oxidoreductase subunit C [Chthonomonas sp.]